MAYNLSKGQKDLLSLLVGFPDDVLFITRMNTSIWVNKEEIEIKYVPKMLTITGLKSLESKGLILYHTHGTYTELKSYPSFPDWEVTVLQEARALVANDFQETAVSPPSYSNKEEAALLTTMNDLFSDEEIQEFCFGMGIDYENIPGNTKRARIMGLIQEVRRNGRLLNLVTRVIYARPNHNWIDALS